MALGRHTWLFVGDQVHATRWAAAYTLAHTALAHGLNRGRICTPSSRR